MLKMIWLLALIYTPQCLLFNGIFHFFAQYSHSTHTYAQRALHRHLLLNLSENWTQSYIDALYICSLNCKIFICFCLTLYIKSFFLFLIFFFSIAHAHTRTAMDDEEKMCTHRNEISVSVKIWENKNKIKRTLTVFRNSSWWNRPIRLYFRSSSSSY